MRRKNHSCRTPRFEKLESRWMLAGDVDVVVDQGKLVITGDGDANDITITAGSQEGEFVVTGNGTTLNDGAVVAGDPLTVTGVTKNISISMAGDDDTVTLDGTADKIEVPQSLRIRTGDGNDTVDVSDTNVKRHLNIDTGDGEDDVNLDNVKVRRNLHVSTGNGNDQNVVVNESQVRRNMKIDTGAGEDIVDILMTQVGKNAEIDTGAEDDILNIGDWNALAPTDGLEVGGRTRVTLRNGDDAANIDVSRFHGGFLLKTGSGGDDVDVDDCEFLSKVKVKMKAGDDDLVEGDDAVNTFFGNVLAHGGGGTNTLVSDSPDANFKGKRKFKDFI